MSSFNTTTRSTRSDAKMHPNVTSNDISGLESQIGSTGTEHYSPSTLIHRDALGRVKPVNQDKWCPHGWYLDPNDAKLAEIQKVQGTHNMHSKLPWVIQMAASSYESDGKGVLTIRSGQYALACLALPWLVSCF
jgi:hypothetical protein